MTRRCNRANNKTYVDRLMAANALVVQFPTWSFGPPAMLKGWFDRMFGPGIAMDLSDPSHAKPLLQHHARLPASRPMVVRAGRRSPWPIRRARSSSGICRWFTGSNARVRYHALYHMNTATPAKRSDFLAKVRREMERFSATSIRSCSGAAATTSISTKNSGLVKPLTITNVEAGGVP